MGAGFIRRYSSDPGTSVLQEIEGVVIIDQTPIGEIQGVGVGTGGIVGEFVDMSYGVSVDGQGNVTTSPDPVQIFGPQDMLDKLGGFDETIGDTGDSGGSGFLCIKGRTFNRLVACPVNLCSPLATRAWRQLPTCKSSTDPTPAVPMSGGSVAAGREFKNGSNRVRLGAAVAFKGDNAYLTGVDGTVTNVPGAATSGSVNASAGPHAITPGQHTDVKIDGGSADVYTWGATSAICKMAAAGAYAGGHAGTFTVTWTDKNGVGQTATVTVSGSAVGELALIAQINDALALAGVPVYAEDSGDSNKLQFKMNVYGTSTAVAITAITGGGAFTTDTGIAVTAQTTAPTATLQKNAGAVTAVTIAFMLAATDAQISTAIANGAVGQPTGGTVNNTGPGGVLKATVTATGSAHSIQIAGTSTNSLGFDNAVHSGTDAGAGGGTSLSFQSPGSDFINGDQAVLEGDILVTGVIGGAGAFGADAFTLRVVSVSNSTTLVVEQLDGSNFNWSTSAALPWRLHIAACADAGGNHQLSAAAGYTIPARPLDATIAQATAIAPTVAPAAATATSWDTLSGLMMRTHVNAPGLVYDPNVQAPNLATTASLEVLYQTAMDSFITEEQPARSVDLFWLARHSDNLRAAGKAHELDANSQGISRLFVTAPQLSMQSVDNAISNANHGVGLQRDESLLYSWPGAQMQVAEAVGFKMKCADGSTTLDGLLDVAMDSHLAALLSMLAPERNPGEATPTTAQALVTVLGYQRGVSKLGIKQYTAMRQYGICGLRIDQEVGPIMQSGVTTSLKPGEKNINRRRFANFVEDSIAAFLNFYAKQPLTDDLKDAEINAHIQFFEDLLSVNNPKAQRIAGYLVDPDSGNTQERLDLGIYKIISKVKMTPTADFMVVQAEVGTDVVVTASGG